MLQCAARKDFTQSISRCLWSLAAGRTIGRGHDQEIVFGHGAVMLQAPQPRKDVADHFSLRGVEITYGMASFSSRFAALFIARRSLHEASEQVHCKLWASYVVVGPG